MSTGTSQGRGRGHGRGRNGGRGRVNRRNKGQGAIRSQEKKFYPHSSEKYKQTFTFQSVKEDIKQKIQRTFIEGLDIVISLQKEDYLDLQVMKPPRQLSDETNVLIQEELNKKALIWSTRATMKNGRSA